MFFGERSPSHLSGVGAINCCFLTDALESRCSGVVLDGTRLRGRWGRADCGGRRSFAGLVVDLVLCVHAKSKILIDR